MEKKTTQRIIGLLVAVAFVIVLLPFLFTKNEKGTTQTTSVNAPPFPDKQTSTLAESTDAANPQSQTTATNDTPTSITQSSDKSASPVTPTMDKSEQPGVVQPQQADAPKVDISTPPHEAPGDVANATTPKEDANAPKKDAANSKVTTEADKKAAKNQPKEIVIDSDKKADDTKKDNKTHLTVKEVPTDEKAADNTTNAEAQKKPIDNTKSKHNVKSVAAINSVSKFKTTVWVVQMGSFRDKNNARRLADKLRVAGYKAFMHEVTSSHGSVQTRVYIGPEMKQASAVKLSSKVEHEMNLHGFIVTYKPLEL